VALRQEAVCLAPFFLVSPTMSQATPASVAPPSNYNVAVGATFDASLGKPQDEQQKSMAIKDKFVSKVTFALLGGDHITHNFAQCRVELSIVARISTAFCFLCER
jgi:hypothetical protein